MAAKDFPKYSTPRWWMYSHNRAITGTRAANGSFGKKSAVLPAHSVYWPRPASRAAITLASASSLPAQPRAVKRYPHPASRG